MESLTPLQDQLESEREKFVWLATSCEEAVKTWALKEVQMQARLALYDELVKALRALEEHVCLLRGIYRYTQGDDEISQQMVAKAQAALAQAETIEKEAKG